VVTSATLVVTFLGPLSASAWQVLAYLNVVGAALPPLLFIIAFLVIHNNQ
jgi:hypothetical protein